MPSQPELFTPVKVGSLELPNRTIMSPMTRCESCVPSERMVRYYSQRASAGLIITEGTHPSPMGRGLYLSARPAHGRAGGGLAESDQCRPRFRGPYVYSTHARRAGIIRSAFVKSR